MKTIGSKVEMDLWEKEYLKRKIKKLKQKCFRIRWYTDLPTSSFIFPISQKIAKTLSRIQVYC